MNDEQQKLKVEFNFPNDWDSLGCANCKSPFHEVKDCPQTKTAEPKFRFKTRKELKVKEGTLPFKFRVDIDPQADNEAEVTRKRALLRLNSNKVYNLMGMAVKAQEAQRSALQWLLRFCDELDVEDKELQEERAKLLPVIQSLQEALSTLTTVRKTKIRQAEEMEEVATNARNRARQARMRISKKAKQPKEEFWLMRLPNSNIDIPVVVGQEKTPAELFKEVADAIRLKEQLKQYREEMDDTES